MKESTGQKFFGIVIQKELLANRELNLIDKVIYGYISSYKNCCYESNSAIADKLGISSSSVSHSLSKMAKQGMIFVYHERDDNSKRRIYPVFGEPNKLALLRKKYTKSTCGKLVENSEGVLQNLLDVEQNLRTSTTGVSLAKFANKEYRIKKNKAKIDNFRGAESPPKAMCGAFGGLGHPDRESEDFEQQFYRWNTIRLGAD